MNIQMLKLSDIKPYEKNPRKNDEAVKYVAESIKNFGFKQPIVIDKNNIIVAGHTRYKASAKLGLKEVPCIIADDLTEKQIQAYRLADNKVAEKAEWDFDLLTEELDDLLDFDMSAFGFEDDVEVFDENDLDEEVHKENVIISINCKNINDYEQIKERLQNLTDEIEATLAVKMA